MVSDKMDYFLYDVLHSVQFYEVMSLQVKQLLWHSMHLFSLFAFVYPLEHVSAHRNFPAESGMGYIRKSLLH